MYPSLSPCEKLIHSVAHPLPAGLASLGSGGSPEVFSATRILRQKTDFISFASAKLPPCIVQARFCARWYVLSRPAVFPGMFPRKRTIGENFFDTGNRSCALLLPPLRTFRLSRRRRQQWRASVFLVDRKMSRCPLWAVAFSYRADASLINGRKQNIPLIFCNIFNKYCKLYSSFLSKAIMKPLCGF